jgi:hypothetical protein
MTATTLCRDVSGDTKLGAFLGGAQTRLLRGAGADVVMRICMGYLSTRSRRRNDLAVASRVYVSWC